MNFYKLVGKKAVPCDAAEGALGFSDLEARQVDHTTIGSVVISTVFLVTDHGYDGTPMLFETMIFGSEEWPDYQERYTTWDEAARGHRQACALVMGPKNCVGCGAPVKDAQCNYCKR